jgi:hypothetical protein
MSSYTTTSRHSIARLKLPYRLQNHSSSPRYTPIRMSCYSTVRAIAHPQCPRLLTRILVHHLAHLSLVTFSTTTAGIRDTLMRMAMINNSASASALLHAMLAYSSLHHHGLSETSLKFKVQALHLLSTSAEDGELSLVNASQHVAASMLLGSFEVCDPGDQ